MKIIFLGTNGWFATLTGNTACVLIDAKDRYVVFDVGNGIYKLDKYITENKPISLFISHFHLDHVGGLSILERFDFKQGIDIYVAKGRKKDLDTLYGPPYTVSYKPHPENPFNLKTKIRVHELAEGDNNIGFPVSVIKQYHVFTSHGYKITLEGKTIAYTGDCGLTDSLRRLAQNTDVLISECGYAQAPQKDIGGHVDPIQAATVAKEGNVKKLLLTHFSAPIFLTLNDRKKAEEKARTIFPATIAATDDLDIEI